MSSSAKSNTALLAPGAAAKALSLRTKVSYGLPMIFLNGAGIVVRTVLPKYYNDELGVGVGTLSLTIFVCGMIDLASSIAFAYAGDTFGRTRWGARWGRRKPFIAVGTPFLAVAVLFLLFPPPSVTASATSAAAWFAGAYTFYVLAMQCVGVAYDAMGPAVTLDGQQRGSLYSWKAGLGVGGLIVFAGFQAGTAGLGEAAQTKTLGIMLCALAFVCYGALLRFVPLPAASLPASSASAFIAKQPALVPGVHLCGRNAQWRAFVLLSAGMSLLNEITAVAAFYVQYSLQPGACPGALRPELPAGWDSCKCGDDASIKSGCSNAASFAHAKALCQCQADSTALFSVGIVGYALCGMLAAPLVSRALGSGKIEKKRAALYGFAATAVSGVMLLLAPAGGGGGLFYVSLAFTGLGVLVLNILLGVMIADVIDYDELVAGARREGIFMALTRLPTEFTGIAGRAFPLMLLSSSGFRANVAPSAATDLTLRLIMCVLQVAPLLVGALALRWFQLDNAASGLVAQLLRERRANFDDSLADGGGGGGARLSGAGDSAVAAPLDPVTGQPLALVSEMGEEQRDAVVGGGQQQQQQQQDDDILHLHQREMALFGAGKRGAVLLRARLHAALLLLWVALLLVVSVAQCQRTLSDAGDEDSTEYNVTLLLFTLTAALLLRLWYDGCRLRAISTLCRDNSGAGAAVARCARRYATAGRQYAQHADAAFVGRPVLFHAACALVAGLLYTHYGPGQ